MDFQGKSYAGSAEVLLNEENILNQAEPMLLGAVTIISMIRIPAL